MRKPDFLFIGPDKSGSSWLYHILSQHPDCYVPRAKDIYFFDRYFTRGEGWYLRHFAEAPDHATAVGELSHDYLFSPAACQRIANNLPQAQLLVCLRNPIERSLSQFQYMRRSGEVGDDFWAAVQKYPKIIDNSRYLKHLRPYLAAFPRAQLHLLVFDDLAADPRAFGLQVLTALGLRGDVDLPYADRVREAGMARSRRLSRLLKAGANLARVLGAANLVGRVKHSRAAGLAYRKMRPDEVIHLTNADKAQLWGEFSADIPELSAIVGRDLSHWAPR